jgi:asparagine synthase (glutamine-hydrolysing)
MPGINIVIGKELLKKESLLKQASDSLNILKNYLCEIFISNNSIFLCWNKYNEYPLKTFSYNNYSIIIEGKIYNKRDDEILEQISFIIDIMEKNNFELKVSEFISSTDGDYIIILRNNENGQLIIFNDIFGRLPLFYQESEQYIIVSRSLKFMIDVSSQFEFDKLAMAQFLIFGYMLGKRTLLQNIDHLRPASLLQVRNNHLEVKTLNQFNFQFRKYENRKMNENIENLTFLFSQACKSRFNNSKKNIVTLSGGLDSRLNVACMFKNNISFDIATMSYKSGHEKVDVKIAKQLSKLFNANFNAFEMDAPEGEDLYELLRINEGMNTLATSAMLQFYKKIEDKYGKNINFITGDNGDKLIYTIDRPIKDFSSLEELAFFIVKEHSIIDISEVAMIMSIEKQKIIDDLINILVSFPEENLSQKYLHFRIIEKPFKSAFIGEDRHRNYFWHLTPFWSIQFFDYIMNCSDNLKVRHKLFGSLIEKYSRSAIELPYSNFKSSVKSLKGKIFMSLVYYFYPQIPAKFKGWLKDGFLKLNPKVETDAVLLNCINDIFRKSKSVSNYFTIDFEKLIKYRKVGLYNLLTITSVISYFYDEDNSFIEYFRKRF